ncbi:methyltransferase [Breoghania sp. L-A4]|uniref:methyltransferase n=1 Tax=Breoghania sp. L-A4 TaxID=2304600 RepID=UPI00320471CE
MLDTQAGLDVTIDGAGKGAAKLFPKLGQVAFEADLARLSVDGEVVIEARPPALNMDGVAAVPAPGGFTQASAQAEAAMAERVLEAFDGARQVVDLYCGLGTFALRIARTTPVHAVENDRAALKALDAAWRRAKGLKAVSHEARDLARRPLMKDELEKFDAAVFDPPRAGARAQAEMLAASAIKTIAAVSCNPATLARDLRILVDGGYTIKSVLPVDQFLFSPHIEVVVILKRE